LQSPFGTQALDPTAYLPDLDSGVISQSVSNWRLNFRPPKFEKMASSDKPTRQIFPTTGALRFGARPALIVIDVCNAYSTPDSPLYTPKRFDDALATIEQVIEYFRSHKLPIVFTKISLVSPNMGGRWFTEKLPNIIQCFAEGEELGQYPSGSQICQFRPGQSKSEFEISKHFSSCFFGTSLSSLLVSMNVDTSVIVGFSTRGCIRATTMDAIQHGFRPFVVGNACGDRDDMVHSSNLYDIQAKIGEVVTFEQLKGKMKDLDTFCVDTGSFERAKHPTSPGQ